MIFCKNGKTEFACKTWKYHEFIKKNVIFPRFTYDYGKMGCLRIFSLLLHMELVNERRSDD